MAENTREHLWKVVDSFGTAMLVTRNGKGMRGRPMVVAERDGDTLWFVTGMDSPKVRELQANPHVVVTMQSSMRFTSLTGDASVVTDRARIERLWKPQWKVWFPEGKDDPKLCLVAFKPVEGEYWDESGAKGLRYLFEAAKALATGTTPNVDAHQHAKVNA